MDAELNNMKRMALALCVFAWISMSFNALLPFPSTSWPWTESMARNAVIFLSGCTFGSITYFVSKIYDILQKSKDDNNRAIRIWLDLQDLSKQVKLGMISSDEYEVAMQRISDRIRNEEHPHK